MKKTKKYKINNNKNAFSIIMTIIFTAYAGLMVYMLAWALINSVKLSQDFVHNPFGLPREEYGIHFENYTEVLFKFFKAQVGIEYVYIDGLFFNSILYGILAAGLNTIIPMAVAYVVAKYNFALKNVLYTIVVVTMIMPIIGGLPSMLETLRALNIYDTIFGIISMKFSFIGTYFLVFYGSWKGIDNGYAEAARIDGAGHWRIFLSIMLPLNIATMSGVFLLQFIANWNDYLTPLVYWPSRPTISYVLYNLKTSNNNGGFMRPHLFAACIMCVIPIFTLFMITKNKIIGNIRIGGLKG